MKKKCATCGETKEANRTRDSEFGWNKGRYRYDCKLCVNMKARKRKQSDGRKKAKRVATIKDKEAIARNPHGFIAASIIERAIHDWRKFGHVEEKIGLGHLGRMPTDIVDAASLARKAGHDTIREELLSFFASDWFEELAGFAGCEADYLRKHIGVE